jgi:hypothetical protein
MPIFYNIEPFKTDLHAVQGDKIVYSFNVTVNEVAFDMTGYRAEMQIRRKDGLLLKNWSSGVSPADIVITTDILDFNADGFLESGIFDYDLQIVNISTGDIMTIMYGQQIVQKQFTK